MISCSTCRERCLRTLIGTSFLSSSTRPSVSAVTKNDPLSRSYASVYKNRKSRTPEDISPSRRKRTPWLVPKETIGRIEPEGDEAPRIEPVGGVQLRRRDRKIEMAMGEVLKKHQAYANDPLKLAEFVKKALRGDDIDTATAITRAASRRIQCVVSWNHLLDWQLSKGRMNTALKTFNEMKKRGQVPDAHTFTIIIRGCTEHKDSKAALSKVLAIFHSMQLDRSPVKPNTIHLNAIIKMCARAHDMDAMFQIVAQMPAYGVSSPNNLTYTTIINALRMDASDNRGQDLTPLQKRQHTEKLIFQARHLWRDIVKAWRSGALWLDEELVCAMGRLMLLGQPQDIDDILSLVEQSFNIPRQMGPMNSSDRNSIDHPGKGIGEPLLDTKLPQDPQTANTFVKTVQPKTFPPGAPGRPGAFAKPGRNSLSLVMQALLEMGVHAKGASDKYWQIFVNDIGVKPDIENYHAYMRMLRLAHASTQMVELLQTIPPHEMRPATFRIAISSCARDKRNHHTFANAGKILDVMTTALKVPDLRVLATYLDISMSSTVSDGSNTVELSREAQGKQILRALQRLGPFYINLKSFYLFGKDEETDMTPKDRQEYREGIILLAKRMVAAYNVLMDKALVDRSRYSELTASRSRLSAFVQRQIERRAYYSAKDYKLPQYIEEYINENDLDKAKEKSKSSPVLWRRFVEKTLRAYDAEQREIQIAKEMQEESASATSEQLSQPEKIVAEGRQATEEAHKGVYTPFNEN